MAENKYLSDLSKAPLDERVIQAVRFLFYPILEVIYGFRSKSIPLNTCLLTSNLIGVLIATRCDLKLLEKIHLGILYPHGFWTFRIYCLVMFLMPFWIWGLNRTRLRREFVQKLSESLNNSGLINALGKMPAFISDRPVDEFTRKLRLTRAGLTKKDFEKAKDNLESALGIYVDEIRERRETGTIDIIYAHEGMPTFAKIEDLGTIKPFEFVIGRTRSKEIKADLLTVPHLLVAGQTGGGKSTFLRSLITALYLRAKNADFTLVDLKGGLEFQLFEDTKRIRVVPDLDSTVGTLKRLHDVLDEKMKVLKEYKCKDLVDLQKKIKARKVSLEDANTGNSTKAISSMDHRHIVVIDEAAEIFLSSPQYGEKNKDIFEARRILSKIARQGRSVGIHLVISTQRPDTKAVDSQVKANLPGVICFQMQNDASSITVLGNGRATDLPSIPGRAIWKYGAEMTEIQTPYLSPEEVDTLLRDYRIKKSPSKTQNIDSPAHVLKDVMLQSDEGQTEAA